MRKQLDAGRLRRFLTALGAAGSQPATAYLVGGASAVLDGWRSTTIDVDLYLEPEVDDLLRAIPKLKDDLEVNVEFASPLDFLPELPGWRDRSRFVSQEGLLTVRDFDFYSQALSKLERGFDTDLADVRAMVDRGLVATAELDRLFDAISGSLYRFPAVDGDSLKAAVKQLR
jgi:hypothetical protein